MLMKSNRCMWDLHSPYAYRNDNLRALGFKTYRAYLASALWKSIRRRVFQRDGFRCVRCQWPKKLQVHHRAYDPATLRGDTLNSLSTVCGRCHTQAEQPRNLTRGRHRRLTEANRHVLRPLLKRLRKQASR